MRKSVLDIVRSYSVSICLIDRSSFVLWNRDTLPVRVRIIHERRRDKEDRISVSTLTISAAIRHTRSIEIRYSTVPIINCTRENQVRTTVRLIKTMTVNMVGSNELFKKKNRRGFGVNRKRVTKRVYVRQRGGVEIARNQW